MKQRECLAEFAPSAPLLGPPRRVRLSHNGVMITRHGRDEMIRFERITAIHLDTSRPSQPVLRLQTVGGGRVAIAVGSSPEDWASFCAFATALVIWASRCNPLITHRLGACNRRWMLSLIGALAAIGVIIGVSWALTSGAEPGPALLALATTPLAALRLRPVLTEGPERTVTAVALRDVISRLEAGLL